MSARIIIASKSNIKLNAVVNALNELKSEKNSNLNISIDSIQIKLNNDEQCSQPLYDKGGREACLFRINYVLKEINLDDYDYIVSIENYICPVDLKDYVYLIIYSCREAKFVENDGVNIESLKLISGVLLPDVVIDKNNGCSKSSKILADLMNNKDLQHKSGFGLTMTYGNIIHELYPTIPHDNWMAYLGECKDRTEIIKDCIKHAFQFII